MKLSLKCLLVCQLLLMADVVFGQNPGQYIIRGDIEYARQNYYGASLFYDEAIKASKDLIDVKFKLADAYFKSSMYEKSLPLFEEISNSQFDTYPQAVLNQAKILHLLGRYRDARVKYNSYYKYFCDSSINQVRIKKDIANCKFAENDNSSVGVLEVKKCFLHNSGLSALSILEVHDSLVITSSMTPTSDSSYCYSKFHLNYHLSMYESLIMLLNKRFTNVSDISFSPFSKDVFFSSCVDSESEYHCSIFKTTYDSGKWCTPYKLTQGINLENSSSTQPYVTRYNNKQTLFFVSNRPGGKGKYDIWYSNIEGTCFSSPSNAGQFVNTPGDDVCPFFDTVLNRLYFSSDWHEGYGGLDVFYSQFEKGILSDPKNLGKPFNTSFNDLYFSINKKRTRVYFTSNRDVSFIENEKAWLNNFYTSNVRQVDMLPQFSNVQLRIPNEEESIHYMSRSNPFCLYFANDYPDTSHREGYDTLVNRYVNEIKNVMRVKVRSEDKGPGFSDSLVMLRFNAVNKALFFTATLLSGGYQILIKIKAYTSSTGGEIHNIALAKRREESVLEHILSYQNGVLRKYMKSTLCIEFLEPSVPLSNVSKKGITKERTRFQYECAENRKVEIEFFVKSKEGLLLPKDLHIRKSE